MQRDGQGRQERYVSMKSGLEDRNNWRDEVADDDGLVVSMKSGLEDRNNSTHHGRPWRQDGVSMKSGLEDRNNLDGGFAVFSSLGRVSMKSGLEDRNNSRAPWIGTSPEYLSQ